MVTTWPLPLLYEDASTLVVNKPAGIPSVGAREVQNRKDIAHLMAQCDPDLLNVGSPRDCGVVHRLDNDTSGCLIVARTPQAYEALRQQFSDCDIRKEYRAIVIGHPAPHGQIDTPIDHVPNNRRRMRCVPAGAHGLPAHTEWEVLHRYPISPLAPAGLALVQLRITTGVRHQIRVHMAQLGHPLVGDVPYQSRAQRRCDRLGAPHHLLHAHRIGFLSPATQQRVTCEAQLPPLFERILKTLDETDKRR